MLNVEQNKKHIAATVQYLNGINPLKLIGFNLLKLMSVFIRPTILLLPKCKRFVGLMKFNE